MAEVAMTEKTQEKTVDERPVVLKVDHVAKMFRLPTEQATGLKMAFLNWTKGIKGYAEQHVLRDINFEVQQGDFFGNARRNGWNHRRDRIRKVHTVEDYFSDLHSGAGFRHRQGQAGPVH